MSNSILFVKREAIGVTEITLNRPNKRNALNIDLMTELCRAVEESNENPL
ncbi:MAG: hypothetical protein K940chlam7_01384, partial [Chlamydiae bacterium]|nr:hypothetical protein [Chlamydiota bacterium]